MTLYDWPRAAAFGRVIPKNKIYEHATASATLKEMFVREVDQILWSHKLAPETINLAATKSVAEIQVFRITQREATLSQDILRAIDRAIPFPLLFELAYDGKTKLAAAYKRPNETDGTKWVLGEYFESEWLAETTPRMALPLALNMSSLYEQLLTPLIDEQAARLIPGMSEAAHSPFISAVDGQPISLETKIAQAEAIKAKTREIERIKGRLAREKQFNKRIAINAELRAARQELEQLGALMPDRVSVDK